MFLQDGNIIRRTGDSVNTFEKLEVGNYLINLDINGYFLEKIKPFTLPKKIYGDYSKLVDKFLLSFNTHNKNLGILLTGLKGTGKSLTAKSLCIQSNLPVILINSEYYDDNFKSFLNSINQECIVFIDEFEKKYNRDGQGELLSVLDGVFESKKIYLFTSNNRNINEYMLNRPGRIKYLIEYDNLENEVVDELINDKLNNLDYKDELIDIVKYLGDISFDSLNNIIEEVNMLNESPGEVIKDLNIEPSNKIYDIAIMIDDTIIKKETLNINPFVPNQYFDYENENGDWKCINYPTEEFNISNKDDNIVLEHKRENVKIIYTLTKISRLIF